MTRKRHTVGKVDFEGFTLVKLPDHCSRKARAFWQEGHVRAVLQQNGRIGVQHTGMFDDPFRPRNQWLAACCLHGLGLIDVEVVAQHRERMEAHDEERDLRTLERNAERLGYSVKKVRGAKKA